MSSPCWQIVLTLAAPLALLVLCRALGRWLWRREMRRRMEARREQLVSMMRTMDRQLRR